MEIVRLCLIAVITAISALFLRANKSDLVPLCITAGGIIMLLQCFDYLTAGVGFIKDFAENAGMDESLIRSIFKIIGIGFVFELTSGSIKDLGFGGVAEKLILCGKIVIFIASIPIFRGVYQVIVTLTQLV